MQQIVSIILLCLAFLYLLAYIVRFICILVIDSNNLNSEDLKLKHNIIKFFKRK